MLKLVCLVMKHFLTMYHMTDIMQSNKDMKLAMGYSSKRITHKESMAGEGKGREIKCDLCTKRYINKVYGHKNV